MQQLVCVSSLGLLLCFTAVDGWLRLPRLLEASRSALITDRGSHAQQHTATLPRCIGRRAHVVMDLPQVPRVDARTLTRAEFAIMEQSHPVVLTNALDYDEGGVGKRVKSERLQDEEYCDLLLSTLGEEEVDYMVKEYRQGVKTQFFSAPLYDFVDDLQSHSRHDRGFYLLSEDMLEGPSVDARLRDSLSLPVSLFGEDLFPLFPQAVRPKERCVIIGGTGARSHLHADPFEWVGVNHLLEGRKKWVFLPPHPDEVTDRGLESERLGMLAPKRVPPVAWDGGQDYNVSAGWLSELDLYRRGTSMPASLGGKGPGGELLWEGAVEVVQEEGDLIVIPPRWWHQVYHLEPSFCVASQYTNLDNLPTVLRHMLKWCGCPPELVEDRLRAIEVQFGEISQEGKLPGIGPFPSSARRDLKELIMRVIEEGTAYRRQSEDRAYKDLLKF